MLDVADVFWIRLEYLKFVKYFKSDADLRKIAGISTGSWDYWKYSKRLPSLKVILAISEALNVKIGWLLGEIPMESLESEGLRQKPF